MLALHLGSQARDVGVAPPGCPLKSPVSLSRHPAPPSPPSSMAGAPRLVRTPSQDSGCTLGKGSFPPSILAGVGLLGASVNRVTQAASWETPGGHRQAPAGASLPPSFSSCPLPAPTQPVCEAPTQGQTLRAVSAFREEKIPTQVVFMNINSTSFHAQAYALVFAFLSICFLSCCCC